MDASPPAQLGLGMHLLVPAPARAKDRRGFGSIIGAGTGTDRGICRPRDAKLLPGRGSGSRLSGRSCSCGSLPWRSAFVRAPFDRAPQDLLLARPGIGTRKRGATFGLNYAHFCLDGRRIALFLKMSGGGPLSPFIFCPSSAHSILATQYSWPTTDPSYFSLNPFNTFCLKKKGTLSTD
jgi:hypothetical protein